MRPDKTGKKQDTRFKPGQSGNPAGRPKGSRNKFTECLVELIAADCEAHARELIEKVRQKYPVQYVRLIVSLLPKPREDRPAEREIERLSDEEIVQIIRETRERLAKVETDDGEE
jgi:Family of unknown function (DUF5681)